MRRTPAAMRRRGWRRAADQFCVQPLQVSLPGRPAVWIGLFACRCMHACQTGSRCSPASIANRLAAAECRRLFQYVGAIGFALRFHVPLDTE